jgi:hypothetical protein
MTCPRSPVNTRHGVPGRRARTRAAALGTALAGLLAAGLAVPTPAVAVAAPRTATSG